MQTYRLRYRNTPKRTRVPASCGSQILPAGRARAFWSWVPEVLLAYTQVSAAATDDLEATRLNLSPMPHVEMRLGPETNPFMRFNSDLKTLLAPGAPALPTSLAGAAIEKPASTSPAQQLRPDHDSGFRRANSSGGSGGAGGVRRAKSGASSDGGVFADDLPLTSGFGRASLSDRLAGNPEDRVASVLVNEDGLLQHRSARMMQGARGSFRCADRGAGVGRGARGEANG